MKDTELDELERETFVALLQGIRQTGYHPPTVNPGQALYQVTQAFKLLLELRDEGWVAEAES